MKASCSNDLALVDCQVSSPTPGVARVLLAAGLHGGVTAGVDRLADILGDVEVNAGRCGSI